MTTDFNPPSNQDETAAAIPVRLVLADGSAFYNAEGAPGANTVTPTPAVGNSPTNVSSGGTYVASGVLKASAGTLYGLSGYNSLASAQFILLFDSATVPADAAAAVVVISVQAASNFFYDPGIYGRAFATGISWSNSTTAPTKTLGAANCFLDAQVE